MPEGGELFLSQKLDTKTEEEKREVLGILSLASSANVGLLMLFMSGMKLVDAIHGSDGGSPSIVRFTTWQRFSLICGDYTELTYKDQRIKTLEASLLMRKEFSVTRLPSGWSFHSGRCST
jgi:hypothetical protein